jgi:LPS-assembly protein
MPANRLRTFLAAVLLAGWSSAMADEAALRLDRKLKPPPPKLDREALRFLRADEIEGNIGQRITASGNVEIRQVGLAIRADRIVYEGEAQLVTATGNVRFDRDGDVASGPRLVYDLGQEKGEMDEIVLDVAKRADRKFAAHSTATRGVFEEDRKTRLFQAEYTTCPVPRNDWFLRVRELELDNKANEGIAYDAAVHFLGVPILYSPYLNFPLNNKRKSGFLAPAFGSSGQSGFEFALPYYWNIADEYDATITPKLFSKRGVQLGAEFRYLKPTFMGELGGEYMPHDRIADRDRYFVYAKHNQTLYPGVTLAVNVQAVSDDNYFRDLSTRVANTSIVNLPRDVVLGYNDANWAMSLRTLSYQVLQDPGQPITPPYTLAPQVMVNGFKQGLYGFDVAFTGEVSRFRQPTLLNGDRLILYPTVSLPLVAPWGFLTAKAGFNYNYYNLPGNTAGPVNPSLALPIASADAGLFFDRPFSFGGRSFVQTIEPRLYYVYAPFRDQSDLPNFTTDQSEFNFRQIFSENIFVGGDRVNSANAVTAAITTRFFESATGLERLRAAIGQRRNFTTELVTLSGTSTATGQQRSDLLAQVASQVTSSAWLESTAQYSTNIDQWQRFDIGAKYAPEPGKIFNASYRYTRNQVDQVDLSTQWPVAAGWTGVARWNYSIKPRALLEALVGFEYNSGCWQVRAVAHRFITSSQQVSTSFQIQLELNGLSRIGINPLETLRQNIAGYRRSDELNP